MPYLGHKAFVIMMGYSFHFGFLIVPAVAVSIAALYDYKWRRIPNFITFPALGLGLLAHAISAGWGGLVFSLKGLAVGGGAFLIFYLMGAIGAGDVKLMGSVGACLGAERILTALMLTVFIGGLMALWKLVFNSSAGNIMSRFRRLASDFSWKAHFTAEAANINPLEDTIPYGVAIAIGTLITLMS